MKINSKSVRSGLLGILACFSLLSCEEEGFYDEIDLDNQVHAILNGEIVTPTTYDSRVWLHMANVDEAIGCTGTMLNPHWVLTAAHCVSPDYDSLNNFPEPYMSWVGRGNPGNPIDWSYVHSWHVNPDTDVALLRLQEPMPMGYYYSAKISNDSFEDLKDSVFNKYCYGYSFGKRYEGTSLLGDMRLRRTKVKLLRENDHFTRDFMDEIEADEVDANQEVIVGDSGGGCFLATPGGLVLFGLISNTGFGTVRLMQLSKIEAWAEDVTGLNL